MATQERNVVGGLVLLMVVLWGGFIWHSEPSFPGSFVGSMIGIAATILLFIPFFYMMIKRSKSFKKWVTGKVSMSKLLLWHIYAGVLGPILGLLHSAHRFDSTVGVSLVLLMMLVAISGFIGRYILSFISSNLKDKKVMRSELQVNLEQAKKELYASANHYEIEAIIKTSSAFISRFWNSPAKTLYEKNILQIIDALSDVEYSIRIHDAAKLWFKRWLKFHIVISMTLYLLLIFHIGAEIYFGLRWL
jgi:hypothetical protein